MSANDELNVVKDGVSIVSEIIKAAGDNPKTKEAANNVGHTAVTLTKAINNVLLPIAAVNFAFDKARVYFESKFQNDLAEKTLNIPPEYIIEPKASIAGPTLNGLAFTHEELNLKEMYLSLLSTAMDGRVADNAHPAFVEIIKQLNSEEAQFIKQILQYGKTLPIAQIQATLNDSASYKILIRYLLNNINSTTKTAEENPRLPAMIDNWIRLGLIEVEYDITLTDVALYQWVEQRPEFLYFQKLYENDNRKITSQKGILAPTELGKLFAKAIGLLG